MSTAEPVQGAPPPAGDIAVFWDLENLDREGLDQAIPDLVAWLGATGRIVVNEAFGDFTYRLIRYEAVLARARVTARHVAPRRKHLRGQAERKNLADIVLTLAVADCVHTKPGVRHIVIVSGDSDFVELAEWCRAHGSFVTGLAGGRVTDAWPLACDRFWHFADLLPGWRREASPEPTRRVASIMRDGRRRAAEKSRQAAEKGRRAAGRAKDAVVGAHGTVDLDRERVLLADAFRQAGPGPVRQGDLANIVRTIEPGFTVQRAGRSSFSKLIDAHRSLIDVGGEDRERALTWSGGRDLITALAVRLAEAGRTFLAVATLKSWALVQTERAFDERAFGCRSMVEFVAMFPDVFKIEVRPSPAGAVAILVGAVSESPAAVEEGRPAEAPPVAPVVAPVVAPAIHPGSNGYAGGNDITASPPWTAPAPSTLAAVSMPSPFESTSEPVERSA